MNMLKTGRIVCLMLAFFAAIVLFSVPSSQAEEDTVQTLIDRQLEAIRARNADRAFSLMTGDYHEKYPNASGFLDDMRFSHRSLYNHATHRFLDRIEVEGAILQKVEIKEESDTDPVLVIYRIEQSDEGQWKIDSFTVLDQEDGKSL